MTPLQVRNSTLHLPRMLWSPSGIDRKCFSEEASLTRTSKDDMGFLGGWGGNGVPGVASPNLYKNPTG